MFSKCGPDSAAPGHLLEMVILASRLDLLNRRRGGAQQVVCACVCARVCMFIEVKSTKHKINGFKVDNSVTFTVLTEFYNHLLSLVPKQFPHPQENLYLLISYSLLSVPQALETTNQSTLLSLWICSIWIFYTNGITQCVAFHVWLPSLSIMSS